MPDIKNIDFVEQVAGAFEARGLTLSDRLFNEVMAQILKFSASGGVIDSGSKSNKQVLAETQKLLENYFASGFFSDFAPDIVTELSNIQDSSEYFQQEENGVSFSDSYKAAQINPIKKIFAQNALDSLGQSAFNTEAASPIMKVLLEATQFGYTLKQTQSALKASTDSFGRYTGQVVRDSMFGYDGQINGAFAAEIGADAYKYSGSIIQDSRPQCRKWVKMKTLPFSELAKEIAWANKNGNGMRPNTTKENFAVLRGGYNCRHRAIPIKIKTD